MSRARTLISSGTDPRRTSNCRGAWLPQALPAFEIHMPSFLAIRTARVLGVADLTTSALSTRINARFIMLRDKARSC